ncbi:MAG: tetratricopeptide repeat protein [Treponema sp.]|jgi:tetratricopeptide (TPR) repeat protein|nr:tetratricopeptide repeat protein [Treponema sp.]
MEAAGNTIVFLSVPESLRGRFESMSHERESGADFSIDPGIPIPVELPPGESKLDLEQLSWEMILSGMIRIVGEHSRNPGGSAVGAEDADYYRRFVLAVKPDIMEEFTGAAILKARNGDYGLALEIMDALRGLFPVSPAALLNRTLILEKHAGALEQSGRDLEAGNEFEKVRLAYQELIALEPPFPDGLFNAGFFYVGRQSFDKARECFSAYLSLEEGDALLPKEKKAKARKIVREIESRALDDTIFRQAYDYIRLGEEQKGLEHIRFFLGQHPRVWNGWFILGWGLRRLSRWEEAAAAFAEALELGGDNSDTRNELAICLMEQGKFRDARKHLETALRKEPDNVKIISNLGVLALRQGEDDEAAAFFRTVLDLEPEDPLALEYFGGKGAGGKDG